MTETAEIKEAAEAAVETKTAEAAVETKAVEMAQDAVASANAVQGVTPPVKAASDLLYGMLDPLAL